MYSISLRKNCIKLCLLFLFMLFTNIVTYAQVWRGKVVDEAGRGVPYAIVSIVNSSGSIIYNVNTFDNGLFIIPPTVQSGKYTFKIASIGYDILSKEVELLNNSQLPDFILKGGYIDNLDEVVVLAEKKLFLHK